MVTPLLARKEDKNTLLARPNQLPEEARGGRLFCEETQALASSFVSRQLDISSTDVELKLLAAATGNPTSYHVPGQARDARAMNSLR